MCACIFKFGLSYNPNSTFCLTDCLSDLRMSKNQWIFYNKKKSWEGTIAAWIVAFLCGLIYLPISYALLAASFSSIIESLPLKSLDNLLVPISTGILLMCLGYS